MECHSGQKSSLKICIDVSITDIDVAITDVDVAITDVNVAITDIDVRSLMSIDVDV